MKFADVRYGDSGTSVIVCQSILRSLQYLGSNGKPLEIDGIAGANTCHAIFQFQKVQYAYGNNVGLDGIFNEKCWQSVLGDY